MTDLTPLSPAAQAVLDAYQVAPIEDGLTAAAVLRAAADQLTVTNGECSGVTLWEIGFLAGAAGARQGLLAIADELEGANPNADEKD